MVIDITSVKMIKRAGKTARGVHVKPSSEICPLSLLSMPGGGFACGFASNCCILLFVILKMDDLKGKRLDALGKSFTAAIY